MGSSYLAGSVGAQSLWVPKLFGGCELRLERALLAKTTDPKNAEANYLTVERGNISGSDFYVSTL